MNSRKQNNLGNTNGNDFPNNKMPHQQTRNRFFKEVRDESDDSGKELTVSSFIHNKLPRKTISADLLNSLQSIMKTAEE